MISICTVEDMTENVSDDETDAGNQVANDDFSGVILAVSIDLC